MSNLLVWLLIVDLGLRLLLLVAAEFSVAVADIP
jgi:hypothetical protein